MRILLDTHALLWWLLGDGNLSTAAKAAIGDERNEVLVSAASAWEIATKFRLGKLAGAGRIAADIRGCLRSQGFVELAIAVEDGQRAGSLVGLHRDPFDRMLAAQALRLDVTIVSNNELLDLFAVRRVW
ncbi:MAG: type II toxin-antitoxin system VapC family toxin [Myxococcales bacterium]|nr:type II toxin-antitoxin system VapC family toxin [Myxococcales bacterium]